MLFRSNDTATTEIYTSVHTLSLHDALPITEASVSAEPSVSCVLTTTATGDSPQPPTASLVQHLIGADRAAAFDINVVCAGFVFALSLANSLIATKPDAIVLIVAADVYSRILDFGDRRTAILFGDGAGAAVIGAVPAPYGLVDVELVTRGDGVS